MIFLQLFVTFFLIGLFGFGGGYAMLSLIQGEVVCQHGWLTSSEFADVVAVSQMTPGPIGINTATFVGYRAVANAGYSPFVSCLGSLLASFAEVLPQLLLMAVVLKVLVRYWDHPVKNMVFDALRPVIVGLIGAAALLLMNEENFGRPDVTPWQFGVSVFIFVATFVGVRYCKVSPIRMVLYAAVAGGLLYI